jgi:lipopolysaccharide assembly outer membrane protein LptD (OstA)
MNLGTRSLSLIFAIVMALGSYTLLHSVDAVLPTNAEAGLAIRDSLSAPGDTIKVAALKPDSLSYVADSIAYQYDTEQIYLSGNTSIQYQKSTISADSLNIDLKKDRAFSTGRTVMQDADQILIGKQVYYDVSSRQGMMFDGSSKMEKGYYYGDELRRIDDNIYDVDGGRFTTCDDPDPDFYFWSKQMRMYRNDKIVGKPVIFYVNHFPIFYFPFMTFSVKRGRQQGFLIPEPGYNQVDGKFIRNIAYFYPYKDFGDATLAFDLMERTGWALNLQTRYVQRYRYNGSFDMSYRNSISDTATNRDYAVQGSHHQELGEKATFDVNLDYVSNKRIWESSDNIDQSLAQRVSSSMSFRKPIMSNNLNAGATYTQNLTDNTVSLSLPSASYSFPQRPVSELFTRNDDKPVSNSWWSNFNYSYNVRLDHTGELKKSQRSFSDLIWDNTYDTTGVTYLNEHHAGIKHTASLSYSYKMLGWLNLTQGFSYNEAWMDRDENGKKWVRGNDYNANTSARFTIYGLRKMPDFYVSAIRHLVTPSVSFSYNPGFPQNDKYYYFGGIGLNSSNKSRYIILGLDQKWQIKLAAKGDIKERKINDIISWVSTTGINLEADEHKVADISHSLSFNPAELKLGKTSLSYKTSYSLSQNPYELQALNWKLKNQRVTNTISLSGDASYTDYFPKPHNDSFSAYLPPEDTLATATTTPDAATGNEAWSLSLAQDFNADRNLLQPKNNNLRLSANVKLTTNWSLNYSNYYSITSSELISQSFDISRTLHCWKLDISYTRRNEYWDYRIVFYNLQLPDALKFQTRDSKRY